MKNSSKVLVFIEEKELLPAGGPAAVCYYYDLERKKRNENFFSFLPNENGSVSSYEAANHVRSKSLFSRFCNDLHIWLKYNLILGFYQSYVKAVDINSYSIIHFHDTMSLYRHRNQLKTYNGLIILQSHTPQPMAEELFNIIPKHIRFWIPFLKTRLEKVDRYAFNRADYIIFPCPEAEEPYLNRWPYFGTIKIRKSSCFRYVLTGIPNCSPKRPRNAIFDELKLPRSSFIVSYVGRHNEIKGYGDLKIIGKKFLEDNPDSWMICAGTEGPIRRLDNNNWLEIGWTNDAHSYISASDVFILPNKETYFDIVMLEVLSLGKIVIASRTGGNKYFEKAGCKGVFLYSSIDEAVSLLNEVKKKTEEERKLLGEQNMRFFLEHNTVSSMYEQYKAVIDEISKNSR